MLIALAAILATLLTGCASQTPVASSNQLTTSLTPLYLPTTTPLFVAVASATPTLLSHPTIPITPSGKVMIYIVQFQQPLDVTQRKQFLTKLEQQLGRPVTVIYHYTVAYQGLALQLTAHEASTVATMPQVKHIQPDSPRYPQPSSSPHLDSTQTE